MYHKLRELNSRCWLSHSLETRRLKSRCQQNWFQVRPERQGPVLGSLLRLWVAIFSSCLFSLCSLCVCLSLFPNFPPLIRTPVTWIRTHPNDLILAWLPLWRPYSKYGHILKYQGLGFHHIYIYIYTCTFGKSQDLTNTLDGFRVGLLRLMGFPKLQTLPKWCQSLDLAPASEYKECGLGCGGHSKHMTWE